MRLFSEVVSGALRELDLRERRELYRNDPVLWATEYLGVHLWSKQREILCSLRDNLATAVKAGHAVSKTHTSAVAICWWVSVHPVDEVYVATTAPSVPQIRNVWDEVRRLHSVARERYEAGLVDQPLPGYITGDNVWKLDNGVEIGRGRKPPDSKPETAFQGKHANYLLALADEAVAIPGELIDSLGNIATGANNRQLLVANPTDPTCRMAKLWAQAESDPDSIWNLITVSVFDNPNFVADPDFPDELRERLSGEGYVKWALEAYGDESDPRYRARVLGEWASDSGDTVFSGEEVARARNTFVRVDPGAGLELGCDISRFGSDISTVYSKEYGEVWETDDEGKPVRATGRSGVRLRRLGKWSKAPIVNGTVENPDTTTRIHQLAMDYGASVVKVDASGIGASVIDGLAGVNTGAYQVVEVFGGARPDEPRSFVNQRAEQFFKMKLAAQAGELDIDPADEELADEMMALRYERNERQIIRIESKDSMKRRGVKSPDFLDGASYAFLDVGFLFEEPVSGGAIDVVSDEFDLGSLM